MIVLEGLWKQYPRGGWKCGLTGGVGTPEAGLNLSVHAGEIFGLIGPDGAGKTTLIRVLATLLCPSGGRATVGGLDLERDYARIRSRIGYVPQVFSLYHDLTVAENIRFYSTIFGSDMQDSYSLIEDIYAPLAPFARRKAGALSGGMKQKLMLCCALIHRPRVLFLDEPTTGVDPVSRTDLWATLRRLKGEGITVLVSTAYMNEASQCDRIALMREGRCILTDTPEGVLARHTAQLCRVRGDRMHGMLKVLQGLPTVVRAVPFGESHHVTLAALASPESVREALTAQGFHDATVEPIAPGVEDCFIALSEA